MGKQRTPQGRSTGRRGPPNAPTSPKTVQVLAPEAALHPAEDPRPAVLPEPTPEPLHAHLLDTVSPEVLATATPAPEPLTAPADTPVPADANLAEAAEPDLPIAAPEVAPETASETAPDVAPEIAASAADVAQSALDAAPVAEPVPAPEAPAAYTNVVPLKSAPPPRPFEPVAPAEAGEAPVHLSDGALPSPASWRAGHRPVTPLRQDLEGMGETLFAFMRNESSAVLTHLNALKDARSPADAIRLQVTEIQRAADASLTCWSEIARRATRIVAQR